MTIEEFMELCIEPSMCKVEIYDCNKGEVVWSGYADELPDKYGEMDVESFDVPTNECMTFNIG